MTHVIRNPDNSFSTASIEPADYDAILLTTAMAATHKTIAEWNTGNWNTNPPFLTVEIGTFDPTRRRAENLPPEELRPIVVETFCSILYPDNEIRLSRINPQDLDGILLSESAIVGHLEGDTSEWNSGDWRQNPALLLMVRTQETHCHWSCAKPQHGHNFSERVPVRTLHGGT